MTDLDALDLGWLREAAERYLAARVHAERSEDPYAELGPEFIDARVRYRHASRDPAAILAVLARLDAAEAALREVCDELAQARESRG